MRYAFYISGKSGRLYKFLRQAPSETLKNIILVVSDKTLDEKLQDLLKTDNIKLKVLEYNTISGNSNTEKNKMLSDWMKRQFDEHGIDYCFSFGEHILSGELLEKYEWRLINFHPAILPMYPGRKAIDQAVNHGNTFLLGNTAHFVNSGVDEGKIIMQSVIPMNAFFDSDNDYDVVLDLQIPMLNGLIRILDEEKLIIENGNVRIKGAIYTESVCFPRISDFDDMWEGR